MEPDIRPPRDEDELRATWAMLCRAFGWDPSRFDMFRAGAPIERTQCVFVGGEPVACARIREFGQFFGEKRVAMGGFSPVAVAADYRGRGFGSRITAMHFPLMRERGEVLAGLYPATNTLYRKVGFEIAGVWASHHIATRELQRVPPAHGIAVHRVTESEHGAVEACYARLAASIPGFLDRNRSWWDRIFGADGQQIYAAGDGQGLAGYVRYKVDWPVNQNGGVIEIGELMADDPEVAHALWRLVGSSSSIAPDATIVGPPEHTLLLSLPEQDLEVRRDWRWMSRVIDAPGAVAARGYPSGTSVAVDLRLTDHQCDWNDGRWRFVLDDGEARLERGGRAEVEMGIGAFSALYTGYASTTSLRRAGRLLSDVPAALARLDAAFAGPTPWMPDFY
jgi:predicted acetyltransferase